MTPEENMELDCPNLRGQFELRFQIEEKVYVDIIDSFAKTVRDQEIRVRVNCGAAEKARFDRYVSEKAAKDYENIYKYSRARLHENKILLAVARLDYTGHLLSLWGDRRPTEVEFEIHLELQMKK